MCLICLINNVTFFVFYCICLLFIIMKQEDLKTIRIDIDSHDRMKAYCDKHGIKMYKWLSCLIDKEIANHEQKINN